MNIEKQRIQGFYSKSSRRSLENWTSLYASEVFYKLLRERNHQPLSRRKNVIIKENGNGIVFKISLLPTTCKQEVSFSCVVTQTMYGEVSPIRMSKYVYKDHRALYEWVGTICNSTPKFSLQYQCSEVYLPSSANLMLDGKVYLRGNLNCNWSIVFQRAYCSPIIAAAPKVRCTEIFILLVMNYYMLVVEHIF